MKIEIKLDDPRFCNGCPLIRHTDCVESPHCNHYPMRLEREIEDDDLFTRPQACFNEHGE